MVYKEKDAQLEDNRSTAYTFLGVGIAGLIFVILFALDIIKLPMADYMRVIMIVVMSVLFVFSLSLVQFIYFFSLFIPVASHFESFHLNHSDIPIGPSSHPVHSQSLLFSP